MALILTVFFSIAGTHTTMATTTLLFWNLLHNPSYLSECINEITSNLPAPQKDEAAYPVTNLEASLPFLRHCMKENYRLTPVFSMPLARRVTSPEGLTIAGHHFPQGVSSTHNSQKLHVLRR